MHEKTVAKGCYVIREGESDPCWCAGLYSVECLCVSMSTDEPRIKQPAFRLTPHVRAALL